MELTPLIQFKTIAECRNMTKAAEKLHISQPALSTSMKKLEQEFGISLFTRANKRMDLNENGNLLLSHVNRILSDFAFMKEEMKKLTECKNIIHAAFCDPGPKWYCTPLFSIANFSIQLKSYDYDYKTANEKDLLLSGTYDFIVSSKKIEHPAVTSALLLKDRVLLSVPKNSIYARKSELCVREAAPERIMIYYAGGEFIDKQYDLWEDLKGKTYLELIDEYFIYSQKLKNTDIISQSTSLVTNYRDDCAGTRILIPTTDPELQIEYYISYLKRHKAHVSAFTEWAENFLPIIN